MLKGKSGVADACDQQGLKGFPPAPPLLQKLTMIEAVAAIAGDPQGGWGEGAGI